MISTASNTTDLINFNDNFEQFSVDKYNSLPCVEEADRELNLKSNFEIFLSNTKKLVHEHGVESFFSIRLLHNHTRLEEGTMMVEDVEGNKGEDIRFITKPYLMSFTEKTVPASWIPTSNGYVAFEYSNEDQAVELSEKLIKVPNFMRKFHNLLKEHNLINIIGPAIITSSKLRDCPENVGLVEETFVEPFYSILSFQDITKLSEGLITTSWMFNVPIQHNCKRKKHCLPVYRCKPDLSIKAHIGRPKHARGSLTTTQEERELLQG